MPRTLIRLIVLFILLILMAVLWRYLADSGFLTLERIKDWIDQFGAVRSSPWLIPGIVTVYVVTLLFGPWWGLLYATLGTLSSSAVTFWVGHLLGRETLERHGGRRLKALSGYMSERSIRSMILINLLPLAPFTFTNLMAGAFNMSFGRYLLGSAISIIPGLAVVTILGGQTANILRAEDSQEILLAIGLSVLVVILLAAVMMLMRKRHQV